MVVVVGGGGGGEVEKGWKKKEKKRQTGIHQLEKGDVVCLVKRLGDLSGKSDFSAEVDVLSHFNFLQQAVQLEHARFVLVGPERHQDLVGAKLGFERAGRAVLGLLG